MGTGRLGRLGGLGVEGTPGRAGELQDGGRVRMAVGGVRDQIPVRLEKPPTLTIITIYTDMHVLINCNYLVSWGSRLQSE